jgi:hypothetical protein
MTSCPDYIRYSSKDQPKLIVVVDTEEEFDWDAEPDSNENSVRAIQKIHRMQEIFDEYNIIPCYVVDYPVTSQNESAEILKRIYDHGRCEIGAHLHPWVNPPYTEILSRTKMYPGNLSYDQEFSKLKILTQAIDETFGFRPEIYRAGRYGFGENTSEILSQLGYKIDLSVCSGFDFSNDGGPDFSDFISEPYWFGANTDLLELPLSGAFIGMAGKLSKPLYNAAGWFEFIRLRGMLSRLSIVDRLLLSPEGFSVAENKKLTHFLFNKGVRIFSWNIHSTTVVPGNTVYTQTARDVEKFLDSFRRYFDFFFDEMNGVVSTPTQIRNDLLRKK